jgi:hypothetical protein
MAIIITTWCEVSDIHSLTSTESICSGFLRSQESQQPIAISSSVPLYPTSQITSTNLGCGYEPDSICEENCLATEDDNNSPIELLLLLTSLIIALWAVLIVGILSIPRLKGILMAVIYRFVSFIILMMLILGIITFQQILIPIAIYFTHKTVWMNDTDIFPMFRAGVV